MTQDIFEIKPTLDQFVGEGKKYSDNDAVAKALVEKDQFIQRLQEEARRREEDFRQAENTRAYEDRIKALEAAQVERREPTPPPTATPAPASAGVDEEAVQRIIEQREAQNARTRNLMQVKDKLTETFGEDYPNRVKARAQELGMEMAQLNQLAASNPSAFYAMLGLDRQATPSGDTAPPLSRVNPAAFVPASGEKGNKHYSELRRTKPSEYWSPRVQMEEYNALKRLGPEKFYSI